MKIRGVNFLVFSWRSDATLRQRQRHTRLYEEVFLKRGPKKSLTSQIAKHDFVRGQNSIVKRIKIALRIQDDFQNFSGFNFIN